MKREEMEEHQQIKHTSFVSAADSQEWYCTECAKVYRRGYDAGYTDAFKEARFALTSMLPLVFDHIERGARDAGQDCGSGACTSTACDNSIDEKETK